MFITCVSRDTCHISHVTCHMSGVRCHTSGVPCQVLHVTSNSQTVRARELKFWEKVHLSPVTCQMSRVRCHISHVTCQMSLFLVFFSLSFFGGEVMKLVVTRWRIFYQRGQPRLVTQREHKEGKSAVFRQYPKKVGRGGSGGGPTLI